MRTELEVHQRKRYVTCVRFLPLWSSLDLCVPRAMARLRAAGWDDEVDMMTSDELHQVAALKQLTSTCPLSDKGEPLHSPYLAAASHEA